MVRTCSVCTFAPPLGSRVTLVPLGERSVTPAAWAGSRVTFVPLGTRFVAPMAADPSLWGLARRQHGVLATRQIAAAGVSRAQLSRLVTRGWLRPVHRGVYFVGPIHGPRARLMAATLAVGDGAVLSHRSAAELWGLGPTVRGAVAVTRVGPRARSRHGLRVHGGKRLDPADVTRHDGIPVTGPARTLLDLATTVSRRDLDRATNEARILRLVTDLSLNEQFSRYPRHRGTAALRAAIRTEPALTRSEAERRLLELVRAARLPAPEVNQRLHGYEVDFVWTTHRLVVEVDGYAFHSSRSSFERDRRRDAELTGNGWRVIRVTWRQLTREPEAIVALLARALAS